MNNKFCLEFQNVIVHFEMIFILLKDKANSKDLPKTQNEHHVSHFLNA